MIGHILDNRYKILEKVGTGGMASVYKAQDILLDRIVAVKILHSKYGNDHDFVVRFRQEAQAAAKLSHPNIVNIYDVGYDENVHYIVMEFVRGETLKEYIEKHGHLPINTSIHPSRPTPCHPLHLSPSQDIRQNPPQTYIPYLSEISQDM